MAKKKKTESDRTLVDAWIDILETNEQLAKKNGKSPLTDDEIVEALEDEFPDKKGKSTIVRVAMVRCDYNAGRGMFQNRFDWEEANGKNRPISKRYDEDGNELTARGKRVDGGDDADDADEKPAKKKASKKSGKKAGGKKKADKSSSGKKASTSGKGKSSKKKGRRKVKAD